MRSQSAEQLHIHAVGGEVPPTFGHSAGASQSLRGLKFLVGVGELRQHRGEQSGKAGEFFYR